jgi:hypothetical protein
MLLELEFTAQEQELISQARQIYNASEKEIYCLLARKGLDRRTNKPAEKANNISFFRRKEDMKGVE